MRIFSFVLLVWLACGCTKHATRPSADVTFQGNYLLFKGEKFTGVLQERFDQVETVRSSEYKNGLLDGTEKEFFQNEKLVAKREYSYGKKHGIHEGWFPEGQRRFLYHYSNDQHDGEAWEWYQSGGLALYARFEKGRLLGKKVWRESGQIYMNYVFTEGRSVGVPGTGLCYQLRDERTDRPTQAVGSL